MAHATLSHTTPPHIDVETQWTEKELIKQVPGARWDTCDKRVWCLPLSWASCVALRGVFGDRLTVDETLTKWSWEEVNTRVNPALELRTEIAPSPDVRLSDWERKLYPFQVVGSRFLVTAGDCLLADEMGTGKTVQALAAIRDIDEMADVSDVEPALPALVICPNSVKINWSREAKAWHPAATPYVVTGGAVGRRKILEAAKDDPSALVIANIESVRLLSRLASFGSTRLKRCKECDKKYGEDIKSTQCEVHPKPLNGFGFKTVIVDEAHRIANPSSKQTRACWAVMHDPSVVRRWALTGTPILSHPGHLWSIMHGVAPYEYPAKSRYVDRYCLQSWNNFGGLDIVGVNPQTKDEFFKIFDPRFRRMPKSLVLPQLPKKIRSTRWVTMTPKQAAAYKDIEEGMMTILESGELLTTPNNLTAATRLSQLASSYADVEKVDPDDITTWQVRLKEPSPKLDEMELILEELGGKKVAVCAESRQLIEMAATRLEKAKVRITKIVGGMTDFERDRSMRAFQEGDAQVMLFTMQAGGTGLTMTATDTLVRLQRSWSMVTNVQTEDRVHRIGSEQHEAIHIIDVVAEDTVEQTRQLPRLYEKMYRLEEITRDRATIAANGGDVSELDAEESRVMSSFVI